MDLTTLEKKIKELPLPSLSTEHTTFGQLPEIRGGRGAGKKSMEKEKSAAGPGVLEVPGEEAGGKS